MRDEQEEHDVIVFVQQLEELTTPTDKLSLFDEIGSLWKLYYTEGY